MLPTCECSNTHITITIEHPTHLIQIQVFAIQMESLYRCTKLCAWNALNTYLSVAWNGAGGTIVMPTKNPTTWQQYTEPESFTWMINPLDYDCCFSVYLYSIKHNVPLSVVWLLDTPNNIHGTIGMAGREMRVTTGFWLPFLETVAIWDYLLPNLDTVILSASDLSRPMLVTKMEPFCKARGLLLLTSWIRGYFLKWWSGMNTFKYKLEFVENSVL